MKKFCFLVVLSVLIIAVLPASARVVDITLLNEDFVRTTGSPVTETRTFTGFAAPATINIYNGAQNDNETGERVSSSVINVNGVNAFGTADFNKNVTSLTAQVNLNEGDNTVSVELRGKPGGKIRVEIVQEAEESKIILSGQDKASQICKDKIDQLGDTEKARIEAVALIKRLPGVKDAEYSLDDGSVWLEYESGFDGVIFLGPEGTQGGFIPAQDNSNGATISSPSSDVLIWAPFEDLAPREFINELKKIFKNSGCSPEPDVFDNNSDTPAADLKSVFKFPDYQTIIIISHGAINKNKIIFSTGEKAEKDSEMWGADPNEKESIAIATGEDHYWCIKPSFIRSNGYRNFQENTVVYNASCSSLNKGPNNDDMYSAFLYKGVNTYYGFTSLLPIEWQQNTTKKLFKYLIEGKLNTMEAFEKFGILERCTNPGGWFNLRTCLSIEEEQSVVYSCNDPGETITFKFTGHVTYTSLSNIEQGDKYTGYISYNTNAEDFYPDDPNKGRYYSPNYSFSIEFPNYSIISNNGLTIYVYRKSLYFYGRNCGDPYCSSPDSIHPMTISFINNDDSGDVFDDDSLPTSVDLADWDRVGFTYTVLDSEDGSNRIMLRGTIGTFERID
jgi:hypothetical protein